MTDEDAAFLEYRDAARKAELAERYPEEDAPETERILPRMRVMSTAPRAWKRLFHDLTG